MNTNSNVYTVIYTTIIVVVVAAVLAFVSQSLKPRQEANEKAETISQILTAAQFGEKDHWQKIGNSETIKFFENNIAEPCKVTSPADLKALNYKIRNGELDSKAILPSFKFSNGLTVVPVYGAGLWGPIWGYIALDTDFQTIVGAYFDHESETPGLGGKIKDDPEFRATFVGKKIDFEDVQNPFDIVKNGTSRGLDMTSKVDAISGATMTSNGLDQAIDSWLKVYVPVLKAAKEAAVAAAEAECETQTAEGEE